MENLVDSAEDIKWVKGNSELEAQCLDRGWLNNSIDYAYEGSFCTTVWDSAYCWPPTQSGTVVTRTCSEIFEESFSQFASSLLGSAIRECLTNGTWANGNESNYDDCRECFQLYLYKIEEENILVPIVHHMLFIGSILSLVCLGVSLAVFYKFRCLQCDRLTIHIQLMLSLVFRFLLMLFIAAPYILGPIRSYRDVDILCKVTLILFLYTTLSTIGWMFVEGLFLNIVLTTGLSKIRSQVQLADFYIIGWGVPLLFVGIFVIILAVKNKEGCWKGYSEMDAIWVLVGPISFELVVNGIFLLNILRILLRKINTSHARLNTSKLRSAAKAVAILFPVLGINNLILLYNPGGAYNKYFVLLNAFFGSTQGIMVAMVFCFTDKDVWAAIQRSFVRANTRRNVNANRNRNVMPPKMIPMAEMVTLGVSRHSSRNNVEEHTV